MVVTEGKTLLEAVEQAKNDLKTENIFYTKEEVKKGGLFKSTVYKVNAISYQELLTEMKNYLEEITKSLGLTVQFETSIRDEIFTITMFSDNNAILIGKNGQTLRALETLCRAKVNVDWNIFVKIVLDVENYKEKRIIHNKLTNFKGVSTVSEGEEPNRHVIIKAE